MQYTSTLTKSGQITLPKPLRDFLSVTPGSRVTFDLVEETITISREKTLREHFEELDRLNAALETPESKAASEKFRGWTASEMRHHYMNSPEGRRYYKEKYGI
jgi:AbrB family looped-hinge helix DNA binding protein